MYTFTEQCEEIAGLHLELDTAYVRKVVALMDEDSSRTDLQVARILVRQA